MNPAEGRGSGSETVGSFAGRSLYLESKPEPETLNPKPLIVSEKSEEAKNP